MIAKDGERTAGRADASEQGSGPNGYVGAIMALQGIRDVMVVVYDRMDDELKDILDYKYVPNPNGRRLFFVPFKQASVGGKRVSASYEDLRESVQYLGDIAAGLILLVCPPDSPLMISDCRRVIAECRTRSQLALVNPPLLDRPMYVGNDEMSEDMVNLLCPPKRKVRKDTVNILGLPITSKDWKIVIDDFTTLLSLMGLDVICTLCANCTTAEIADSCNAEYNVVLCPEYAEETADVYRRKYGIQPITTGYAPVGLRATADLITIIGRSTGHDPKRALAYIDRMRSRERGCMAISGKRSPGRTFAVKADPSVAYPLVKWLCEELSMVPVSVVTTGSRMSEADIWLSSFLTRNGLKGAAGAEIPKGTDFYLGPGKEAELAETEGRCGKGIDIGYPSSSRVAYVSAPLMGPSGSFYVLDNLMN